MLINTPELHLAFHVPSLQAYNSVSLVSLLACLSQLVYSLDVWPSAEWDTHTHTTHTYTVTHLQVIQVRPLCVKNRGRTF